jgi:putative membrane protein
LLVAWVVRLVIQGREASDGARRDAAPGAEPLRLLDERLAKGEIDAEEYQRTRRLLIEHR